jgi:hypothetical protein
MLGSKTMMNYYMFTSDLYQNFTTVRSSSRFKEKSAEEINEMENNHLVACQVKDTFAIGEKTPPQRQNDTIVSWQNGGEEWKLFRPFRSDGSSFGTYGMRVEGDFCLIKPLYFKTVTEHLCGNGDYCGYCGSFNGASGEYRTGYDCHSCQSN